MTPRPAVTDPVLRITSADYPPSPLSPVLPWCRERLLSLDKEELVARLNSLPIPPSHGKLLYSYVVGNPEPQQEVILRLEGDFEKIRLFQSVYFLFYSLVERDFIEVHIAVSGQLSHSAENFYIFLEEMSPLTETPSVILDNIGEIIPWDGVSKLPPPEDREDEDADLLRRAMEFSIFGDNIQACRYFDILYGKHRLGTLTFETDDRVTLFHHYAMTALNLNQEDLALTVISSLLNMALLVKDDRLISLAYGLTGEVYRRKDRFNQAIHFFRKSLEPDIGRGELRFKGLFSLFLCTRKVFDAITEEERKELLLLAGELNRPKSKGIILLYTEPSRLDEVVELFARRDNPILRSQALLARGIYEWRTLGERERAEKSLSEALEISKGRNILYQPMRIRHFLGRFYEEAKDFEKAFRCYSPALEGYLREERFEEMAGIYLSLADMGFALSRDTLGHSFLRTARYIINRLPDAPETLRDELSRRISRPQKKGKIPAGQTSAPDDTSWFGEPIEKETVTMGLKQHVRYEQLKKGMYEINLLSDIQAILSGTEDRDRLILLTMERLLSSSLVSSLSYYERLEDSYRLAYHSSLMDEEPDRSELGEFLASWNGGNRKISVSPSGLLLLPVIMENIISGVIICRPESPRYDLSEEDKQVFAILTNQFSSTLEKLRQKELILSRNRRLEAINRELTISTLTDPLTGIGNRIQMNDKIEDFSSRYGGARERDNFALLFIDLDNFKYYNDTYGHPVGDKLLEDFSHLLGDACRESDCIFRYGGDEFVLLLAETDGESSALIADRILFELEEKEGYGDLLTRLGCNGDVPREHRLGCSIGISDFRRAGGDGKRLLKQADTALYGAKEAGKGRWKIHAKEETDE